MHHAPKRASQSGEPHTWVAIEAKNAHTRVQSPPPRGLHWTVLAQLIRRGGLKNGPLIHPNQVDGRVARLRSQAKAEFCSSWKQLEPSTGSSRGHQCTELEQGAWLWRGKVRLWGHPPHLAVPRLQGQASGGLELASALGMDEGEEEERQCLVLHPAAGILMWEGDWDLTRRPKADEVKDKARELRAGLRDQAANAIAELGDPEKPKCEAMRMIVFERTAIRTIGSTRPSTSRSCRTTPCSVGGSTAVANFKLTTSLAAAQAVKGASFPSRSMAATSGFWCPRIARRIQ